MPARQFKTFQELFDYRSFCPICSKHLVFTIEVDIYLEKKYKPEHYNYNDALSLQENLEKNMEYLSEVQKISKQFNCETKQIDIPEISSVIDIKNNKIKSKNQDIVDLIIFCNDKIFPHSYESECSMLSIEHIFQENKQIEKIEKIENIENTLDIPEIEMFHEIYKVYDINKSDDTTGSAIHVINDYNINKTSFSITEANLDGTNKSYKEKRINLVNDDYFTFNEPSKVLSRLNSIFLFSND